MSGSRTSHLCGQKEYADYFDAGALSVVGGRRYSITGSTALLCYLFKHDLRNMILTPTTPSILQGLVRLLITTTSLVVLKL
jgi:hypothetical protein